VFLEILLALGLLQPEYPKYVLNAWSQLGSKIACDVAALAREISDACAPGPSGESDRPLGGWVNVRYAAFRPVCRNLTSRLSRLTRLCPPAEQIFRRQRNEAYAYFHATGDVLRQLVQGEAARGEETSRIIGPLVRLDVNGYLRFIAALHAYHNVGTYGPGNGGIRGLLETVHDAYGLSDSFPTAWLEACSKGDVAKSLVERLRDDAVAEVLGLNEHGAFLNALLCTLGAMAAEAAHSLMNHPDWPAQGDCAMLGNLR
jgi:hypothetical protein